MLAWNPPALMSSTEPLQIGVLLEGPAGSQSFPPGQKLTRTIRPSGTFTRVKLRRFNLCMCIGKCMVMYQADHEDVLPPNLHTLVLEVEAGLKMFACPSAGTERSPTTAPADFREHCDYIFTLCSQPADLPSDLLCGYELPLNHTQWFVNRLYYDMHVAGAEDMNEFRGNIQKVNDFLAEKRGGGQ